MYRGRTFSLSFPPFTKAVKWLILINAGMYLLITILQLVAPELGNALFYGLLPSDPNHGSAWMDLAAGHLFLPA